MPTPFNELKYLVVDTDNLGGDYPNESFVTTHVLNKKDAEKVAKLFNDEYCSYPSSRRYYKVVETGYKLQPGFEP